MARSLQKDLDRIAENADTSTPEGLSYVLTGLLLKNLIIFVCLLEYNSFVSC